MTLVGYFNSMRELGGMRRVVDDAVRTRLFRMDERGLAHRSVYPENVEELTSRIGQAAFDNLDGWKHRSAPIPRNERRIPGWCCHHMIS